MNISYNWLKDNKDLTVLFPNKFMVGDKVAKNKGVFFVIFATYPYQNKGEFTRFSNPEDDMVIPMPGEPAGAMLGSKLNAGAMPPPPP